MNPYLKLAALDLRKAVDLEPRNQEIMAAYVKVMLILDDRTKPIDVEFRKVPSFEPSTVKELQSWSR